MSIQIERVDNGWIVTDMDFGGETEVFRAEEEMLTRVHELVSDWDIGDKVSIIKERDDKAGRAFPSVAVHRLC